MPAMLIEALIGDHLGAEIDLPVARVTIRVLGQLFS
jgi:hypothetical protein